MMKILNFATFSDIHVCVMRFESGAHSSRWLIHNCFRSIILKYGCIICTTIAYIIIIITLFRLDVLDDNLCKAASMSSEKQISLKYVLILNGSSNIFNILN